MKRKPFVPPTGSTFTNSNTVRPGVCNLNGYTDENCFNQGHKKTHATFGLPKDKSKVNTQKISSFKQTQQMNYMNSLKKTHQKFKQKPAIPAFHDAPIQGLKSGKNFLKDNKENLVNIKKTETKDKPNFLKKKDFGQVPDYLDKVKETIQGELDYIKKVNEEKNKKFERYRKLTAEEKTNMRKNLLAKFEQINHEYQKITHIKPAIGDSRRLKNTRLYCEEQLSMIEKHLNMLNKDEVVIDLLN